MEFPFYPAGLIVSALFLGTAMVAFGLALTALDRGAAELRGSIGTVLVRGVRAWTAGAHRPEEVSPGATPLALPASGACADAMVEDLAGASPVVVEEVRRSVR